MMSAAVPLPAREIEVLAKICGLLGSDHEGERANAAAVATRRIRDLGLTWHDVILRAARPALAAPMPKAAPQAAHLDEVHALLGMEDFVSEWEREFLRSLAAWRRPLSPRQREKLAEVARRIRRRAEG